MEFVEKEPENEEEKFSNYDYFLVNNPLSYEIRGLKVILKYFEKIQ